jgi:DNA-binding PadR family transcriptional regulator
MEVFGEKYIDANHNLDYYYVVRYIILRNKRRYPVSNKSFSRFSDPTILILASLADGEKHGYAMMEDIEQMAGVRLGPGTLYGAISRLEQQGLICSLDTGDRRRPYRLTPSGAKALQEQLTSLQNIAVIGLKRLERT